jgi:hypothetical protein
MYDFGVASNGVTNLINVRVFLEFKPADGQTDQLICVHFLTSRKQGIKIHKKPVTKISTKGQRKELAPTTETLHT